MARHLVYSIAFDIAGAPKNQNLLKLLASSLTRSNPDLNVVLFHNSNSCLFQRTFANVQEIGIDVLIKEGQTLAQAAMFWKCAARNYIEHERYETITFLDADCLILRSVTHLLDDMRCDLLYQTEIGRSAAEPVFNSFLSPHENVHAPGIGPWGVNSGTWTVKSHRYQEVMKKWEQIQLQPALNDPYWTEQGAWNRLIRDAHMHGWTLGPYESREIQFPLLSNPNFLDYNQAAILHAVGGTYEEKLQFLFGQFMARYFWDRNGTFFNLLEM